MNLLIIGNGFDLAHGLPTRYKDFLKYCCNYNINSPISESDHINGEFMAFVEDNIWLKYFLNSTERLDDSGTWIDFEKEIAEIISSFEKTIPTIEQAYYFNHQSEITLDFPQSSVSNKLKRFITVFSNYDKETRKYIVTNKDIIDAESFNNILYTHLRIFARAFEIYCIAINSIPINEKIITTERKNQMDKAQFQIESYSHQARLASGYVGRKDDMTKYETLRDDALKTSGALYSGISPIDYLSMSKFDCVLSFNYTATYERLYGNPNTQYCYIHGKAQNDSNKTNLIFGIHDGLASGEESRNFQWVRFKKYYQRIIFQTGSEYKDWLTSTTKKQEQSHNAHIVGHSLDRTDYEVLYEIFNNRYFKVIIYYYSRCDFEDKVQKVIQLLAYKGGNGRDILTSRMNGSQWSIKFVNQYDEKEGLFINQLSINQMINSKHDE